MYEILWITFNDALESVDDWWESNSSVGGFSLLHHCSKHGYCWDSEKKNIAYCDISTSKNIGWDLILSGKDKL